MANCNPNSWVAWRGVVITVSQRAAVCLAGPHASHTAAHARSGLTLTQRGLSTPSLMTARSR